MGIFFEIALWGLAIFAVVYFVYLIFFSGHERLRKQLAERASRHRFDRREIEKGDRRRTQKEIQNPPGERRKGRRR